MQQFDALNVSIFSKASANKILTRLTYGDAWIYLYGTPKYFSSSFLVYLEKSSELLFMGLGAWSEEDAHALGNFRGSSLREETPAIDYYLDPLKRRQIR